jgi:hypothetical protein
LDQKFQSESDWYCYQGNIRYTIWDNIKLQTNPKNTEQDRHSNK